MSNKKQCEIYYDKSLNVWRCKKCGYERKSVFFRYCKPISVSKIAALKEAKETNYIKKFRKLQNKPGTSFRALISWINFFTPWWELKPFVGCKCKELERLMNALGWEGCNKRKTELMKEVLRRVDKQAPKLWPKPFWIYVCLLLVIYWNRIKMLIRKKEEILTEHKKEVDFLAKVKASLTKRTFPEAVEYLAKCKSCKNFRGNFCSLDTGSTRAYKFLEKISNGWCDRWKNKENTDTYKFIRTTELVADTYAAIPQIPSAIDLIVGSSRSGLIPATVMATALHLPLEAVGAGVVTACRSGYRLRGKQKHPTAILLVEDTVYNGRTLREDLEAVRKKYPSVPVLSFAVYVHPQVASNADFYGKIIPGRHYLEWNFFNSISISRCIFDMDGILCEDIPSKDDDDGERYVEALKNAKPKYLVRKEPIPIIATARLEKYRPLTEEWLEKWGIRYKKLLMGPWSSAKNRSQPMEISKFKAQIFTTYKQTLFVESDPIQAREIAAISGGEVLCPRLGRVIPKGAIK